MVNKKDIAKIQTRVLKSHRKSRRKSRKSRAQRKSRRKNQKSRAPRKSRARKRSKSRAQRNSHAQRKSRRKNRKHKSNDKKNRNNSKSKRKYGVKSSPLKKATGFLLAGLGATATVEGSSYNAPIHPSWADGANSPGNKILYGLGDAGGASILKCGGDNGAWTKPRTDEAMTMCGGGTYGAIIGQPSYPPPASIVQDS